MNKLAKLSWKIKFTKEIISNELRKGPFKNENE